MGANSFGRLFTLTTFGESHGTAIGGVIDGCPANLAIDLDAIQHALDRRRPGQSALTTARLESDRIQILSGVFEGKTTGSPIGFTIPNKDAKSTDYDHLKDTFRPSHADFTSHTKYGNRDYRGGGRTSARETACRVAAGAVASQLLATFGVNIHAWVHRVGNQAIPEHANWDIETIDQHPTRCPHEATAREMAELITRTAAAGDTLGGEIRAEITGVPAGWGEPVFEKLHAVLGGAMLGINAVKGFEIGSGFSGTYKTGSEHNDVFESEGGVVGTRTNNSGGVQGGISNGQPITFGVAFKPVATLMQAQDTVNSKGEAVQLEGKGRHDACVLPRAVPIVEAMAALVLADFALLSRSSRL